MADIFGITKATDKAREGLKSTVATAARFKTTTADWYNRHCPFKK